jgi:hypothetical protein
MASADFVLSHTAEADRVRAATHPAVNRRIDLQARMRIQEGTADPDLDRRITELGREWDFERVIETEAAATGLLGLALAIAVDRRFLIIPGVATAMMLLHAVHGWYPLLPILRRMGVRTQDEIERERYALKALRGDFRGLQNAPGDSRAAAAWRAVQL